MEREEKIDELMTMTGDVVRGKTKIDKYRPPPVTTEEKRRNKKILRRLMYTGRSNEEIYEIMALPVTKDGKPGPNMRPQTARLLMDEIYAEMAEEAEEKKPYLKTLAQHRIHEELRGAVDDKCWSAVANLEKVLSGIEGTQEPVEVKVETGTRLTEAIMAHLGETDPAKVRELVERGKRLKEGKNELGIINVTPPKEIEVIPVKPKDPDDLEESVEE